MFFFQQFAALRVLPSFPTRRSSDLRSARCPRRRGTGTICPRGGRPDASDRKSTRLNSSHVAISYAVFCLKKKKAAIARVHDLTVAAGSTAQNERVTFVRELLQRNGI